MPDNGLEDFVFSNSLDQTIIRSLQSVQVLSRYTRGDSRVHLVESLRTMADLIEKPIFRRKSMERLKHKV